MHQGGLLDSKMANKGSTEGPYSWAKVLRTLEKSIFRPPKRRTVAQWKPDNLDPWFSWPLRNRIFRPPKWRTVAHLEIVTMGRRISRPGIKNTFRPPNLLNSCSPESSILQPTISLPLMNRILGPTKCRTGVYWRQIPLRRESHDLEESHFQAARITKRE
jgi:hypothetical protein